MEFDPDDLRDEINKYLINLNEDEKQAPILLSIGEHNYGTTTEPTEFATEGNFSVISGAGKSRKSFLKSLLVAGYIGGNAIQYAPDLKTHRSEDKLVLDFDTEQSKYHCQRVFRRVRRLVGKGYNRYRPFSLRQASFEKRLEFINKLMLSQKNIGFVIIDGIADLVADVNNLVECNAVVQKLLEWSDITQCHIVVIIHTNFDSRKSTGHLGSAVMKKAETICVLSIDEGDKHQSKVKFTQTRGFPIDDMVLTIDNHGLPSLAIDTGTESAFKN